MVQSEKTDPSTVESQVYALAEDTVSSGIQWYPVVSSGIQWYPVVLSGIQWYLVVSSGI